jgi:hypothetical protein
LYLTHPTTVKGGLFVPRAEEELVKNGNSYSQVSLLLNPGEWLTSEELLMLTPALFGRLVHILFLLKLSPSGYLSAVKIAKLTAIKDCEWSELEPLLEVNPANREEYSHRVILEQFTALEENTASTATDTAGDGRGGVKKGGTYTDSLNKRIKNLETRARNEVPVPYTSGFERFWESYPKKKNKSYAFRCYLKAVLLPKSKSNNSISLKELDDQCGTWIADVIDQDEDLTERDTQYVPDASTWLNRGSFHDEGNDGPDKYELQARAEEFRMNQRNKAAGA